MWACGFSRKLALSFLILLADASRQEARTAGQQRFGPNPNTNIPAGMYTWCLHTWGGALPSWGPRAAAPLARIQGRAWEGSEPSSAPAVGRGCARRLAKEEEAVGLGMAAIRLARKSIAVLGATSGQAMKPGFWTRFPLWLVGPNRIDVGSFDASICPFSE